MRLIVSRYFLKLVGFSLLLAIFPIVILGLFSYQKASDMVRANVYEGNVQLLRQTQSKVEQLLHMSDYAATQYGNAPMITQALEMSIDELYDKTLSTENLAQSMNSLQTYELGVHSTTLINLQHQWYIDENGLQALSVSAQESRWQSFEARNVPTVWMEEQGTVYLMKRIPAYSPEPKAIIVFAIPSFEIAKWLGQDRQSGTTMMIVDASGRVVARSNQVDAGEDLSEVSYIQQIRHSSEETGFLQDSSKSGDLGVTYLSSPFNGWTYISLTSLRNMTSQSRSIGWFTLAVSLAAMMFAGLFAWFGSQRMYSPIRQLIKRLNGDGASSKEKTAADEFAYIGDRLFELIHSRDQLSHQLQRYHRQMREWFVLKLLHDNLSEEEIARHLRMFHYTKHWKRLCVLVVEIDTLENSRFEEKDGYLLMFAVSNMIGELIRTQRRLQPIIMGSTQVTLIGSEDNEDAELKIRVERLAVRLQEAVRRYLQLKVSIGVSRIYRDWKESPRAYSEAQDALKYRMKLGEEAVVFIEEVQPQPGLYTAYPKDAERKLTNAVKTLDSDQAYGFLHDFMQEMFAEELTYQQYQLSLFRLLFEILNTAQDSGIALSDLYPSERSLLDNLFEHRNAKDIEEWFVRDVLGPLLALLEQRKQIQYKSISSRIVEMIRVEYNTELTLDSCARRLSLSPNYISNVFRKEMGVSFLDYLLEFRIGVAKQWLRDTDMKVGEIAEKLNYNSSANFIRYFRKMTGTTPGQFRDRCLQRDG